MSKLKKLKEKNMEIGGRIRNKAVEKILKIKYNPKAVFKYFTEVFISFLIAVGIFVWIDPSVNIIPSPLSYFFLATLAVILAYIHFAFKAK